MVPTQQTRRPSPILSPGDTVSIVAPCGPVPEDSFKAGCQILRNWGLQLDISSGIEDKTRYLAGTDENRLSRLRSSMTQATNQCVWMARGGYGATRILEDLLRDFPLNPPPLIGFSDGTALHAAYMKEGYLSIHGPVITQLHRLSDTALEACHTFLFAHNAPPSFPEMIPLSSTTHSEAGLSWGGNLALLCAMVGTPAHVDLRNKLLFIEDVGESTYRVDRMMQQLLQTGELDHAKGLILGDFTGRNDPEESWFDGFWEDFSNQTKCPIWKGLPVGHGPCNWMVPLGVQSKIVDNCWTMMAKGGPKE